MMIFVLILILAVFLRFFHLGSLPIGLTWDEAAIGYSGFGIMSVHRDEWLNKMPIVFKSFGDYKAAVAIYADAITTWMFGLDTFGIRFPMAVAGVITTATSYWLGLFLFKEKKYAFLLMGLLAVSPLNIHYSRMAFESGIAVMLVTIGFTLLFYAQKKTALYFPAAFSLVLSLYAYHSTKIGVPLFLFVYVLVFWNIIKKQIGIIGLAGLFGAVLLFPLAKEMMYGNAAARFAMTSVISTPAELKPLPEVVSIIGENYAKHFNFSFLLQGKTPIYRHGNNVFGILSLVEFVLMCASIISCMQKETRKKFWWIPIFILVAIFPAAISDDAPHSNRAHIIIPWIQMLAVMGYIYVEKFFPKKAFFFGVVTLLLIQTAWYARIYQRVYTYDSARDFQYGYKEAVLYAKSQEGKVDKVLLTSAYGQPYIYVLLYKKLTPIEYQQGALANYEIRDLKWDQDKNRKNALIIGTPWEIPANADHIVKEIHYPDGEVAFRIVKQ
ncbi:MAG: hypothetical protein UX35_C0012G0021 [Microgenomates group bacterium GW2011_GWA1_46_15]|nr:MAG: hypothetical protein UX00_C0008G0005 [Microgenomates group bacterium GW2011_GWB1_45_17]KKU23034.1 MAG: hypothetical protein UX35_C0012G0021 [Microgenomates group bacterium GW2011_GWA1_46_15]KKU24764.1 MAG: hypothetical protein UX36_C0001G0381 [Microgenomates group bacterium GW2011_GWC1_46_15]